jgi:hypothetical protein
MRPVHRAIAASLPLHIRRRYLFAAGHGRLPNTHAPKTFSEKVNWRILYDRREQFKVTCDKALMKDYARERSTPETLRIPETLWLGTDVGELLELDIQGDWVLKPNHRSGQVIFGSGPVTQSDVADLRKRTSSWLNDNQWRHLGEWAYSLAQPAIMLERRIAPGVELSDFKILVFDGVPKFVQVTTNRFTRPRLNFYKLDWGLVKSGTSHDGPLTARPHRLTEMLQISAQLGAEWDFMRIDLYEHDDDIWFGEITPYPAGGTIPYRPRSFDLELGSLWTLPPASPGTKPSKTFLGRWVAR